MVDKQIYDASVGGGTDDTDIPNKSTIIQTAESNLDIVTFSGSKNLDLNNLDNFEFIDYQGTTMFKGTIRETDSGGFSTTQGFDYGIELGEIPVRKNFEDKTPLEIMEDVITNFTSLTYVANANIVDGPAIKLYPSQNKKANEIIDFCHKLLNTTHYVDNDKNFNPEYEGEELNATILEVGVNCDVSQAGWNTTTDKLVNNLTVNGGNKEVTETIFLSGDGVSQEFVLSNPYVDITVEYPIGTELTAKLEDSQAGDYEIFKETKKILFGTIVPANAVDNIKVTLTYQLQANYTINAVTQPQILAGTNPHHKVIPIDSLKEVVDCRRYAEKYRNKFKNPIRTGKLITEGLILSTFRANQRIQVKDALHTIDGSTIDGEFIIKKMTRTFGEGATGIILDVGDSTQFTFDRETEVSQTVSDFNETHPSAEIFNEGIPMLDDVSADVQVEVTHTLLVADLPTNILVYDANRQYTNETDHLAPNDGFIYIDNQDFINLFTDLVFDTRIAEDGDTRITEAGDTRITEK